MDETRALLDALMGPNRNVTAPSSGSSNVPEFADKSICKHFLVGFCPHDWFSMPKRQLMPCNKIHSELMKEKFEAHPEVEKYRAWYEEDFLHHLQPIQRDCDNYITREKVKCRPKNALGKPRMPPDVQLKYDDLERRYSDLVKQSEEAADNASLGLSKELMGQALVMQEDITTVREKYTTEFQGEDICEVCGVRYPLGSGGAEWHDKESHKKGKTHQGFATIRRKIDELISKRGEWSKYQSLRQSEYEPMLQKENERERPRERPRDDGRGRRDRERERPREKDRDERERERSRGRTRVKDGDRKDRHRERSRKAERGKDRGRSGSNERSRSRRRREAAKSRSGSRPGRHHKERDASSSRGRREKEKEKEKRKSKGKSEEPPPPPPAPAPPPPAPPTKRTPSSGRRSPDYSQNAPPAIRPAESGKKAKAESSDEAEMPEDEKDGITVLDEDLPEFWARIQKLKGNVRNEAVAALSSGTKDRFERWLVTRVRKRGAAPPAVAKVGA